MASDIILLLRGELLAMLLDRNSSLWVGLWCALLLGPKGQGRGRECLGSATRHDMSLVLGATSPRCMHEPTLIGLHCCAVYRTQLHQQLPLCPRTF